MEIKTKINTWDLIKHKSFCITYWKFYLGVQDTNIFFHLEGASLVTQLVKNPPVMQETPVQFLGQEDLQQNG